LIGFFSLTLYSHTKNRSTVMTQDTEHDIRLQFLEEAEEYLNEIESGLLGMSTQGLDRSTLDGLLRAAHSIKGGGGMMGFTALSQLAHRIEDCFKVLKVRPPDLGDADLESLLLNGVDHIRDAAHYYRQGLNIDQNWLSAIVEPTFDALRDRLGDPQADDSSALLSAEVGADMAVLLFESEVDSILNRLDEVLADPHPTCRSEEFAIAAQELAGLGEMLDLPVFSALCLDISDHLSQTTEPVQVATITTLAQQAWRKAQAMVLVGQRSLIPASLSVEGAEASQPSIELIAFDPMATSEWDISELDEISSDWSMLEEAAIAGVNDVLDSLETLEDPVELTLSEDLQTELDEFATILGLETDLADLSNLESDQISNPISIPVTIAPKTLKTRVIAQESDLDVRDERTIRVSAQQLNQMGELFGELMIERNGLTLQLKRLRELTGLLTTRVQSLEKSNASLKTGYDKVTTQARPSLPQEGRSLSGSNLSSTAIGMFPQQELASDLGQTFDLLEMDRYSELHSLSQELMETAVQIEEVTTDITTNLDDAELTTRSLTRTTKQLQVGMNQMRMRPISDIVGRFPRMIRDLSQQYGKEVELKLAGGSTLIDRLLLEPLNDALIHLLRNSFDHGIETPQVRLEQGKPVQGVIELSAVHRGSQTLITIRDDGAGINLEKIKAKALRMGLDSTTLEMANQSELLDLIFEPGFSTAENVTDLSGRGVGMDIVRTHLQKVRGSISVETNPGRGTAFTIAVPFTLSVIRVLLVESANLLMAFPTSLVEEVLLLEPQNIVSQDNQAFLDLDGSLIPFVQLQDWLTFPRPVSQADIEAAPKINAPTVLLVDNGDQIVAIRVERYWGEQEVTVRQVEGNIPLPAAFAGCTVLGDGRIAPLVDPLSLLQQIEIQSQESALTPNLPEPLTSVPTAPKAQETNQSMVLVVDDSVNVRRFLALTLEKAGFRVEQAKDGQHALEKMQMGLPIQAVICDIEMPRMDGYGFLANVKAIPHAQNVPVVMLTSRSGDKHRKLALSLGASNYFSKPFREKELLETLTQLIAQTA
jgi:two-component system, chemotaxis family, sensor histidine kinase and response regulator PixL